MNKLFNEIGQWAETTFTKSTPESAFNHLKREVKELSNNLHDGKEMADIVMIIAHLASKAGIDLEAEIIKKFNVNKSRRWGEPDEEGVCEHIADDEGEEDDYDFGEDDPLNYPNASE